MVKKDPKTYMQILQVSVFAACIKVLARRLHKDCDTRIIPMTRYLFNEEQQYVVNIHHEMKMHIYWLYE